ncbi:hypothetical protein PV755_00230 [Streptomyces caniscabiei]|uniref:hypothetical protein n=1 Tax=Streptomyces caniscabiei TaxID=2746961 RepID=UPI0029B03145|nr:hypothetical protein [Streptomyces caniscabiei]MDX3507361.1 hypothetical protein [Streptomyces caniscabiei]
MPRTAVAYRNLVANSSLNGATGPTTVDATLVTNGVVINDAVPEQTLIRTTHTDGTAHDLIVRAGNNPALAGGQSDLTVEVAATSGVRYFGPFESGRFLRSDGTMHIDFETGYAGTIDILRIPRSV